MKRKINLFMAVLGFLLIANNFVGVFVSLRNPAIYTDPHNEFANDITLTEAQFFQAVDQVTGDRQQILTQVNNLVNQGMAHNWREDGIEKYHLRVPFYENYILWASSYLYPSLFREYQFVDLHRAVERGVGLCSQQVIVLTQILADKDIPYKIVGLDGHVVATTPVDSRQKTWWIFDPDYGVIIPNNITEIEANPEIVRPYYAAKGYLPKKVDALVGYYGKEGNEVVDGIIQYMRYRYFYEYASYALIWIIPVGMILPSGVSTVRKMRKKANQAA